MGVTSDITSELTAGLGEAGYRYAAAPIDAAQSLWDEISWIHAQGFLRNGMYETYQESWRFVPPEEVAQPKTLVAVAWSSLPVRVRFQMQEGPLDAIVPPTYVYSAQRTRCLEVARSIMRRHGCDAAWARVPVKLLAVRTGLAEYGRNNLAYVRGLGSYVRLGALCTDAELEIVGAGGGALAHTLMEECTGCRACSQACPTGCIPADGTVIDAAHCLSRANENEGDWPDWVSREAHNCLVGCMRCQQVCPADKAYSGMQVGTVAEFDRKETATIIKGLPAERLPDGLRAKLAGLDLDEYSTVLGRNILALMKAADTG